MLVMTGYLTGTGPQGTGPQPRVAKGTNRGRHATHIYTNAVRRGRHIEDVDDRAQNMTRKHRKTTLYAEDERASSTFPIHVVKAPSHAESQAIVSGESAETPVSIHDCGQTLDPYDCDIGQKRFNRAWRRILPHQTDYREFMHESVMSCVEHVRVSRLSDQGTFPVILQVRALCDFKKGSLMLAAVHGKILPKDSDAERLLARKKVTRDRDTRIVVKKVISHLSDVEVKVVTSHADHLRPGQQVNGAADSADATETQFVIWSPLLGPRSALKNLAPFWALRRCAGPTATHNMELGTDIFRETKLARAGNTTITQTTIHIATARNVSDIARGDVLLLPFVD